MAKTIAFDIIARDKASKTFSKIGGAAKLLGVVGLGGVVANAVKTEAAFGKTMNLMQAGTGASAKEMDKLRKLAMKMGADTQFSAGGAADAMLELSRGGIKPAQIQAGALAGTLTLAAAGQLEMGEAANVAVKAMGQFGLKGKDMASIAAALAGGANASSASVRDMSIALAQGGLAANSVGFSIQETTAILAAFSNAGLEGSDAGTSMKTMLDRLQPATEGAKAAMIKLGAYSLKTGSAFVKSNGEFKSAAQIAEILHKGTERLNEAERKRLITKAFGSDAQRAATIMAKEGAAGLKTLQKATNDQSAAERTAAASMKGTGGALERMQGSLETASLAIGTMLAPAVVFLADKVGAAANKFVEFAPKIKDVGKEVADILAPVVDVGAALLDDLTPAFSAVGDAVVEVSKFFADHHTTTLALAGAIATVVAITKVHTAVLAVQAAGGLLAAIKATKIMTTVMKAAAAAQWLWNGAAAAGNTVFILRLRLLLMDATAWVRSTASTVANTAATAANAVASRVAAVATAVATTAQTLFTAATNALTLSNIRSAAAMTATRIGLLAGAAATGVMAAAQWALNVAMTANPIGLIIAAIVALIAIIVLVATKTNFFQTIWKKAWGGIKAAFSAVWNFIKKNWPLILGILTGPIGMAVVLIAKNWGKIKEGALAVKEYVGEKFRAIGEKISELPGKIAALGSKMLQAGKDLMGDLFSGIASAAKGVGGFVADLVSSIKGAINDALNLPFTIKGPGPLPDFTIPAFAKGVRNFSGGLAIVGERGPELVNLPRGSDVYSNQRTRGMASTAGASMGGGGGAPIVININGALDPVAVGRQVEQALVKFQRATGRPLQITTA